MVGTEGSRCVARTSAACRRDAAASTGRQEVATQQAKAVSCMLTTLEASC